MSTPQRYPYELTAFSELKGPDHPDERLVREAIQQTFATAKLFQIKPSPARQAAQEQLQEKTGLQRVASILCINKAEAEKFTEQWAEFFRTTQRAFAVYSADCGYHLKIQPNQKTAFDNEELESRHQQLRAYKALRPEMTFTLENEAINVFFAGIDNLKINRAEEFKTWWQSYTTDKKISLTEYSLSPKKKLHVVPGVDHEQDAVVMPRQKMMA